MSDCAGPEFEVVQRRRSWIKQPQIKPLVSQVCEPFYCAPQQQVMRGKCATLWRGVANVIGGRRAVRQIQHMRDGLAVMAGAKQVRLFGSNRGESCG